MQEARKPTMHTTEIQSTQFVRMLMIWWQHRLWRPQYMMVWWWWSWWLTLMITVITARGGS